MKLRYFVDRTLPKDQYLRADKGKFRSKLRNVGKLLLNGILIGVNLIHAVACSESEKASTKKSTQIYTEPYKGPLLQDEEGNYYMKKRFILIFKAAVSEEEVKELVGPFEGKITGRLPHINAYEIETEQDIDGAIRIIRQSPKIKEATRNYYFFTSDIELDNDKYTRENGPGQGLWWSGSINLTGAYEYLDENQVELKPVTVAVLDSSFDLEARDLKARYVDQKYHYDFADNDVDVGNWDMVTIAIADGIGRGYYRPFFHGTQVSCLVACENNGELTNGVAFNASVLPLKIVSKDLLREFASNRILIPLIGDDFRVSAALLHTYTYREEVNLQVVNMSFTYSGLFEPVATHETVKILYDAGVVLVAAAGNYNQDSSHSYPASFPEVISVGATKLDGHVERRADFSNFSDDVDSLALAAPGDNILTVAGSDMWVGDGTSYSAPMAAGAAALLRSIDPDLSNEEVLETLRDTAADVETDRGTWKLLNVNKAVREVAPTDTSSAAGQTQQTCEERGGTTVMGECLTEGCIKVDEDVGRQLDMEGDIIVVPSFDHTSLKAINWRTNGHLTVPLSEIWLVDVKISGRYVVAGVWSDEDPEQREYLLAHDILTGTQTSLSYVSRFSNFYVSDGEVLYHRGDWWAICPGGVTDCITIWDIPSNTNRFVPLLENFTPNSSEFYHGRIARSGHFFGSSAGEGNTAAITVHDGSQWTDTRLPERASVLTSDGTPIKMDDKRVVFFARTEGAGRTYSLMEYDMQSQTIRSVLDFELEANEPLLSYVPLDLSNGKAVFAMRRKITYVDLDSGATKEVYALQDGEGVNSLSISGNNVAFVKGISPANEIHVCVVDD